MVNELDARADALRGAIAERRMVRPPRPAQGSVHGSAESAGVCTGKPAVRTEEEVAPKKRKKPDSPTKRSLAECRKRGWDAQVVERWNQYAKKKFDLFGVIDIVAITPNGILGIQTTSGDHHAERATKIHEEPRAGRWLNAGGKLEVWSWTKKGERGARKLWTLREETITADGFGA